MTFPVYAYKRGPPTAKRKNAAPEHALQVAVATYLTWALPAGYLWTASAAGAKMGKSTAGKMKAAGQKKGWSDLMILSHTGQIRFIELKSDDGRLTNEQAAFAAFCNQGGHTRCVCCRSVEQVEAALRRWGVPLKATAANYGRYATTSGAESGQLTDD